MPAANRKKTTVTGPVVIGFDPGTTVTGYGVIRAGVRSELLEVGVVRPTRGELIEVRLQTIYSNAIELIRKYNPKTVAVEDPFVGKNPHSALVLGQARGVLLLAAAELGVEVAHYSPKAVKSSIVGRGSASKEQVQFMVQKQLGLSEMPGPLDASDALAVALCHVHRGPTTSSKQQVPVDVSRLVKNPGDADAIARWKAGKGRGR